ncbi:hypothetical protein DL93DRAFT_1689307 [Clavulina sp. PMI_390]|nr:hypothetical protein DL93DRAFT_1689307 [Clavulina sp. PMI_390]
MLAKGAACLSCHKVKIKCDGSKPCCSRCHRLHRQCTYPTVIVRRPDRLKQLRARAMILEMTISKLTLSSTYDMSVISARLRGRIERLGRLQGQPKVIRTSVPVYICCEDSKLDVLASRLRLQVESQPEAPGQSTTFSIDRSVIERTLESYYWEKGEELPLPMSLYLIGIFLPNRAQFQFFMPLPQFLHSIALPPSDPASIHPCLRNACHLVACSILGGRWASLEPYFAERTRRFLDQALMWADRDRITHFLWATTLLASYFMRARRIKESFLAITSASQFATACGLLSTHNEGVEASYQPDEFLLPPPVTEAEALSRLWLAHSIHITDQSLNALTALPWSFVCDERWTPASEHSDIMYPWFKMPMATEEELSKVWRSDVHLNASIMHIFQQVDTYASNLREHGRKRGEKESGKLRVLLDFHESRIRPFSETISSLNPHGLLAHATLNGTSLIFHSLFSGRNPEARAQMLRAAHKLVEICDELQGREDYYGVQSSFVPVVHMMNGIRIFASELRRPETQRDAKLSLQYCHFIEIILDTLDNLTALYPAWAECISLLRDPLSNTMKSLVF